VYSSDGVGLTVQPVPPTLRMIDLFAGCGGLTTGFVSTGHYEPVAAVEFDLAAAATYAANFGEDHAHWGDINEWINSDIPSADVIVGGPPCQGFSNLGARRSTDPRNKLWRRYVDTIIAVHPKAFLLENVDRFSVSSELEALRRETDPGGLLSDYHLDMHIVRATDFGAAQLRRRTIVIGTHRDLEKITVPRKKRPVEEWATVKDAIGDLTAHVDPDSKDLPASATQAFGQVVPGAYKSPDLHVTRHYTDLSLQRFAHIPRGGNRLNLPDHLKARCWIGHDTGSLDVMGRMHWDRPSVTIRTEFFKPEKGRYLHPEEPRAITHHEAARLQGFPDDFQWCGTKLQIARQIGNAVPVPLAKALAQHLHEYLG
jgi:DNA (cytosine-5)-methyltransferase 1